MQTGTHEEFDSEVGWQGAIDHLQRTGILFGGGDIVAVGPAGMIGRIAQVAAFCRLARSAGTDRIGRIAVLLPPSQSPGDTWKRDFRTAYETIVAGVASPSGTALAASIDTIEIIEAPDSRGASIVDLISGLGACSVAIVADAGSYRMAPGSTDHFGIPETMWAQHVSSLASLLAEAAGNAYVWLDVGEEGPTMAENQAALSRIESFAVLTANTGETGAEAAARMRRWLVMAGEGQLGAALAEIDASGAADKTAELTKLRLYSEAGLDHLVQAALRTDQGSLRRMDADRRIAVAHMAAGAGAGEVATSLLTDSLAEAWRCETIETGLMVADGIGERRLAAAYEERLVRLFGRTASLVERHYRRAVRDNDHVRAAELATDHPDLQGRAEYHGCMARRLVGPDLDVSRIVEDFGRDFPALGAEVRTACARHLVGEGRRAQAVDLLLAPGHEVGRSDVWRALRVLDDGLMGDDPELDATVASTVIEAATSWLGSHPEDAGVRLRLSRLLQPDRIGEAAPAILLALLLRRFEQGYEPIAVPALGDRPAALDEERAWPIVQAVMQWLVDGGATVLGSRIYPFDLLPEPPDRILEAIHRMMDAAASELDGEELESVLSLAIAVGAAIGPHGSTGTEDFGVVRVAASRLALAGEPQRARDLAENMLRMTNGSKSRRHAAWFCYADIFARLDNDVEGLVGLLCALASTPEATWDQIYYETTLALRLLRSLNALPLGRGVMHAASTALEAMGAVGRYGHRLETLAIQMDAAELQMDGLDDGEAILALVSRVMKVAEVAEHRGSEIGVAISLLAEMLRLARHAGVRPPDHAVALLERMVRRAPPAMKSLVDALGTAEPDAETIAGLVAGLAEPKYAEDLAFDMRHLVILAHRLLESRQADDPRVAAFAIELRSNRSVSLPGSVRPRRSAPLPRSSDETLEIARAIAEQGIHVVMVGLSSGGLIWLSVAPDGVVVGPVREGRDVFSPEYYRDWSKAYPWNYAGNPELGVFHRSTELLGISSAPDRAVVVADVDLQALPLNLLRCGGELLGGTHKLAAAPSLAWLSEARIASTGRSGRIAWIPTAAPADGFPYLQMIADDLSDAFTRHGFRVDTGDAMPRARGSEIAVVAAHGQLVAKEQRFFRSVRNDTTLAVGSEEAFDALEDAGLVILFVCSGGRLDKHPRASTMIGPVGQLLAAGCSTVIASPWRLDLGVPARWLPTFLDHWSRGSAAVDACAEANQTVLALMGDHPQHWLAMSVHGDPLLRATEHGRA